MKVENETIERMTIRHKFVDMEAAIDCVHNSGFTLVSVNVDGEDCTTIGEKVVKTVTRNKP